MKKVGILGLLALFGCALALPESKAQEATTTPAPEVAGSSIKGEMEKPNSNVQAQVKKLSKNIKTDICTKLGGECKAVGTFTVIGVKKSGAINFVKVKADGLDADKSIWHLRIYERKAGKILKLDAVDGPKKEDDEIVLFLANNNNSMF